MLYTDFTRQFKRSDVVESIRSYGHLIQKLEDGKVLINSKDTEFDTIEEARQYIKQDYTTKKLEEQATKELYEELSDKTIANIINEYHNIKVTDTLVESYKELASSHMFSVDPVVQKIRSNEWLMLTPTGFMWVPSLDMATRFDDVLEADKYTKAFQSIVVPIWEPNP